jgi:predicted anti-sigma-YlaC factor YlaD
MLSSTPECISCTQFEARISEYLDGTMLRNEAAPIREHAMKCRECRFLLDTVKATIGEFHAHRESEPESMPVSLETALLAIAEENRPFDCSRFEGLVTEFLDGFVPAATYHKFEEHAAQCSSCSETLTDVVFAVAACHSVHIYEEFEPALSLMNRLLTVSECAGMPEKQSISARVTRFVGRRLLRATPAPRWSWATAGSIAAAIFALLLYGFSDDRSVAGIYRRAQYEIGQLYSEGTDIYAKKDVLAARIERVGLGIDEIWDGLGGAKTPDPVKRQSKENGSNEPPQKD